MEGVDGLAAAAASTAEEKGRMEEAARPGLDFLAVDVGGGVEPSREAMT